MQDSGPTWDDLRFLLEVHRGKSLLAASKALGVATSTVARRLDALEDALGRRLVHRGTAGTSVDADALGLLTLAEQMELGLDALRRGPNPDRVVGTVRIAASEGFARSLTRLLTNLRVKHPGLDLELSTETRLVDLARREADIGIRIARSNVSSLVEKPLGKLRLSVFAARSYVERRLPSAALASADAKRHDWVGFDRSLAKLPSEVWLRSYGAERFALRSGSPSAIEEAVLCGMGLGLLGETRGAELQLVPIATESAPPAVTVFLAFHREAKRTPRIYTVVRELESALRRALD